MNGIVFGALANLGGGSFGAFTEEPAEALATADFLQQRHHGGRVAPVELQAVGVFLGDNAPLVKLVGEADSITGADGIHAELIAEGVGGYQCADIGVSQITPQRPDGLIIGTFACGAVIGASADLTHLAALGHAAVAAVVFDLDVGQGLITYLLHAFETAFLEILYREDAHLLEAQCKVRSAEIAHLDSPRTGLQAFNNFPGQLFETIGVVQAQRP
ncbi:hypothetical protein ES708_23110 [subsurface metagenome]